MFKPRPYQEEAINRTLAMHRKHKSVLIQMATGCHAPDTEIRLHDGRLIEAWDVMVGMKLMGPDGEPRYVLRTHKGNAQMYRITPVKGDPFDVTHDHKLTLVRTRRRASDRRAGEIVDVSVTDWLKWNKHQKHLYKLLRAGFELPERVYEVPPYITGALLGDGSLRNAIGIHTCDQEIVDEWKRWLIHYDTIATNNYPDDKCPFWSAKAMFKERNGQKRVGYRLALERAQLLGQACADKYIPEQYLLGSIRQRLELLAGLIDTDGSKTDGGYDFISKSHTLARGVTNLCRSVGLAAYLKSSIKTCQTNACGCYWRVQISGDCSIVPVRIPRKRSTQRRQKKSWLRTGFSVKPIGCGQYHGFTVDGDHRYLMGDGTVTHNCGKTVAFAHIADIAGAYGRVLVLAHREELVMQAAEKIHTVTEMMPGIEMADHWVDNHWMFDKPRYVVSTVQTMVKRMGKYDPNEFKLIIIDEAHHATAGTYLEILEYFRKHNPKIFVLGVTATPKRHDGTALGTVFDEVAFEYDYLKAVDDGWLVPIRARDVKVESLDFSKCKANRTGELNEKQVAEIIEQEEALHEVATPLVEMLDGRKAIVFAARVHQAEMLSKIFDRHKVAAEHVDGGTHKDQRGKIFARFRSGVTRILTNVGVATEGFDDPGINIVCLARPTKSAGLWMQMAGRGARPLPGLVDGLETAAERKKVIAESAKPYCELLEFAASTQRHTLASAADVLGGSYDDIVRHRASQRAQREETDMVEALQQEQRRHEQEMEEAYEQEQRERAERERRAKIRAEARYQVQDRDVSAPAEEDGGHSPQFNGEPPASTKQVDLLRRFGVTITESISRREASSLIGRCFSRKDAGLCTPKQERMLKRYGYDTEHMSFDQASKLITNIKANGWRPLRETVQ